MIKKYNSRSNKCEIHSYVSRSGKDGRFSVDKFTRDIKEDKKTGFAGYRRKEDLERNLRNMSVHNAPSIDHKIDRKIKSEIGKTIIRVEKKAPSGHKKSVYVFPTSDKFIKEKMYGVSGFTPYKNTIQLFINSDTKIAKKFIEELSSTLAHELNHSQWQNNFDINRFNTIRDAIVMEGLAQNFEEDISKKKPITVKGFNKKETQKYFEKLVADILSSKNNKDYQKLFFGDKKIKRWTGYAIGYYLVKDFLKNSKMKDWNKIIKVKPKEIIEESGWLE